MKVKEIDSQKNPTFRKFLKILKGQGIKKHGLAFLSGPKQVGEVFKDFPDRCVGIVVSKKLDVPKETMPDRISVYRLGTDLFREIDAHGTNQPILLIRVDPLSEWDDKHWPSGCTLFVPFQNPTNVGAVIRSAAAFGVSRVVILKEAAHPFHHKSIRAAGSSILRVSLCQGPSIRELEKTRIPLITLSPRGKNIARYKFPTTFGLLPGLEGPGLPDNLKHATPLAIPIEPGIESINAALATGIALYVWRSKMRKE
ncbi:MAG: RNA methyltransferase [Desulfobacteraceae bacterium]